MSEQDAYMIKESLVVVSDIHLHEVSDLRGQILLDLISRLDIGEVKHFVLLGDIFDFCFGASLYFKQKFTEIGIALSKLADSGVEVIFFQGNHEFSLEELNWPGVKFVKSPDYTLSLENNTKIALSHGDRLAAPWHYHIYLRFTRSKLFRLCGLLCPQKFLDNFALGLSRKSRKYSDNKKIYHRQILEAMSSWMGEKSCSHGIFGHFHVPYAHKNKPLYSGLLLGLDCWDKPNALCFDGEKFYRYFFTKPGEKGLRSEVI